MRSGKYEIKVKNRERGKSPGEPTERPQSTMIEQECQPILKIGVRFEAASKHDRHTETGNQMGTKCNRSGAAKRRQDDASTTSRKSRFSHSRRSCSSVSQAVYETKPACRTPAKSAPPITDAGMTAMRPPRESATMQTFRTTSPATSTPIAPQSCPILLISPAARCNNPLDETQFRRVR